MLNYLKKRWPEVTFTSHETRPWAAISFTGTRHKLTGTMPNASKFLTEVKDHEFDLPNQLVADVAILYTNTDIAGGYTQATIEILTLNGD